MRELAIFAAGVFFGLLAGGLLLLSTLVRLIEERDERQRAIEEWAEAEGRLLHAAAGSGESRWQRLKGAERGLRALVDEPETVTERDHAHSDHHGAGFALLLLVAALLTTSCEHTPTAAEGWVSECGPRVYQTPSGPIEVRGDTSCMGRMR